MITQKLSISTHNFITGYLPEDKRQTNRELIYNAMLEPYRLMNEEWKTWRDKELILSKVTIEKGSLEWYLNSLFDPVDEQIYIERNQAAGLSMGKNEAIEPADYVSIGKNEATEAADKASISLRGEDPTIGNYRFGVFIPVSLSSSTDAIRAVVRNYNSSATNFIIIEF